MALIDENTAVLVQLEANGIRLSAAKRVDFSYLFSSFASVNSFATATEAEGFEVVIEKSSALDAAWDVTASRVMLPSADAITEAELRLNWLAELHQGNPDGWGFFSD